MQYQTILRQPDTIIWTDGTNSGVIRATDEGWADYQLWLAAGNVPLSDTDEPQELSIDELKIRIIADLTFAANTALETLISEYPSAEVLTWPIQVAEAEALINDPLSSTPMLDEIARGTMSKTIDIAHAVIAKSTEYRVASGEIIAWRRAVEHWIHTAPNEQLQHIQLQYPQLPWESR
ncbi:hypothetical protein [Shewanella xiamenensis]|uniref:hypothetical protein n=1 Tax=Shewanella xiamenensis TaxID=332186 RepID=UPI000849D6DB|nr:hypothetical protein [Shewanella xiamenensis]